MSKEKEIEEYRCFTAPAELHKAVNTLKGIVAGITTDRDINPDEVNELVNWCLNHQHLSQKHPFSELIPLIESAIEDSYISAEESQDIIWLCNNFISDANYYDLKTSSLQFLQGLVHGILADGVISDEEIHALKNWVRMNDYLSGCYPFDEIESILLSILADGKITDEERELLKAFLSNFIDYTTSYNLVGGCYPFDEIESILLSILADGKITDEERELLKAFLSNFIDYTTSYNLVESDMEQLRNQFSIDGICAVCQELDFENNHFCFTGQSTRAKRNDICEIVKSLGGNFNNSVTNKTRYLIVGNAGNPCWAFSCYGRKIEDAVNRRKNGQNLTIVNEIDFWDIVDDLI